MPELPEVETVKNRLLPYVLGRTIVDIDIRYPKYECLKEIKGETIEGIRRRGKFLIFIMKNHYMVSHLRMEGKYFIEKEERFNKHDLVKFTLNDSILYYNDVRKFGIFNVFSKDEDIDNLEPLSKVGPEPFDISKEDLYQKLQKKNDYIKTALLDQSIISGLGNIYVDEVLYKSQINPYRKANSITLSECELIIKHSIDTLNESIVEGGSTIKSFTSLNNESGHFQGRLLVHLRENERCYRCNNIIVKDKCNGRGTYYCQACQRLIPNSKYYAITGGFSSGKSTVLNIIKNKGYKTYSLDEIYSELYSTSKEMLREIKKAFNTVDKNEIKEKVFFNKEQNDILKGITHKYVIKELYNRIQKENVVVAFIEVPLLFEGGFERSFDKIICVNESDEVLDLLLKNKGYKKEDYLIRNASQLDKNEKIKRSDYVINNDSDLKNLEKQVNVLLEKLEV